VSSSYSQFIERPVPKVNTSNPVVGMTSAQLPAVNISVNVSGIKKKAGEDSEIVSSDNENVGKDDKELLKSDSNQADSDAKQVDSDVKQSEAKKSNPIMSVIVILI